MDVRTRMAPSPTGEYHIGHIRTVLYDYAYAKKFNGKFIIRIEDTDRERYVEGAIDRILDVIMDYGFSWDEGPRVGGPYAPYIQSERLSLYKKYAEELIEKGAAYYCFCTPERLDKLREEQKAAGLAVTKYDRHCLSLSKDEIEKKIASGEKYVIRLKVPDNRIITFKDEVWGDISINSNDLDDQVLLKSDGFPTYQLAVVIDDHLMKVSHILRGNDWLPSTPKHVLLYEAFGWELPKHIHLPNLKELGEGKKLSKRYGSVAAIDFLKEGYLKEALVNFLMFLGWNPGTEKEIYSLDEFINDFSIEKIHKTDLVVFDREKLLWYNGYYIRNFSSEELLKKIEKWADKFGVDLVSNNSSADYNKKVLDLVKDRMKLLSDFNTLSYFFYSFVKADETFLTSFTTDFVKAKEIIGNFCNLYMSIEDSSWETSIIDRESHEKLKEFGYSPKEAFMTLRIATTNSKTTPPLFDIFNVLGKEESLKRLKSYL